MDAIVDSNVIIHSSKIRKLGEIYTVPGVQKEMKSQDASRKIQNSGVNLMKAPEPEISKVNQVSDRINSPTSKVDEKLVALALSTDTKVISDDKGVQNLALHLDVDFEGFMEEAITEERKWKKVCSRCGQERSNSTCRRCGSESFERKPR
ncbi:MAG: putative nucleic acid-binding protein [Candidatus Nanosalina sp. J07AB43]|nr:MAG: putative nucleic acid-binding protein [Candidatus Nanosalina sp. J07AB43]